MILEHMHAFIMKIERPFANKMLLLISYAMQVTSKQICRIMCLESVFHTINTYAAKGQDAAICMD